MSTTVTYKGSTLTTVNNQTRVLETAGKYMEDDVTLVDVTGGASAISVVDTLDANGGTIRTITAVDLSPTTAEAADVASGKVFFTRDGTQTTGTASGGGGGSYPWFGSGAEKLSTGLSRTINLKNDTDYDNWTASTTATTLIAASASPDLSYVADIENYDYYFVYKGFVEPVYLPGTTLTKTTCRVCQYGIYYFSGYTLNTETASLTQGKPDRLTNAYISSSTSLFVQYFYNNSGVITARNATQCGPIYMSNYPTCEATSSALSDGKATINFTAPAFYAKCDANRFTTAKKEEVDSANTNYHLTVDIYRIPVGGSWYSKLYQEFIADLNGQGE